MRPIEASQAIRTKPIAKSEKQIPPSKSIDRGWYIFLYPCEAQRFHCFWLSVR
jgi:hypothetical protein